MALEVSLRLVREARRQKDWNNSGIKGLVLPNKRDMYVNARRQAVQQKLFDKWSAENAHSQNRRQFLEYIRETDDEGNTRLHRFALENDSDGLYACLSDEDVDVYLGYSLNAINKEGETPLMIAVRADHYESAVLLLTYKALVNLRVNGGRPTPLHIAAEFASAEMVQLLLSHHANYRLVCLRNGAYVTALDLARKRVHDLVNADSLIPKELLEARLVFEYLERMKKIK